MDNLDNLDNSDKFDFRSLINPIMLNDIIHNSKLGEYINIDKIPPSQIDEYFSNCIDVLKTKPKLLEQFIHESEQHVKTKYHEENLITHLYCVGWICSLFADKFNIEPKFAFELGFFHDIGKPWAKKTIQSKKKIISNSKAHAQIGENICWELGLDKKICWCVSNHMCSCCHENNVDSHWEYTSSIQYISLSIKLSCDEKFQYAQCLACLMIGDDLGRIGDIEKNIPNIITHSDTWLKWFENYIGYNRHIDKPKINPYKHSVKFLGSLHPDNSIIVQMYGCSGFGKSTTAKNLINFLNENNITWEYAERDQSYYDIYSQETGIPIDEVYEKINYKTIYNYIETTNIKHKVQSNWIDKLNYVLDSDSKVKIIDSVQMLYPRSWDSTIKSLNPDAYSVWISSIKFGFYGFPQSLYGREFESKTGKYELIPKNINDDLTWPNINSELDKTQQFNSELLDVAYGSIEFLINSIYSYNLWSRLYVPEKQIHLTDMIDLLKCSYQSNNFDLSKLNLTYVVEHIKNQFPPGVIMTGEEVSDGNTCLVKFSYKDGRQIFHGPTRDYRGETLLFDTENIPNTDTNPDTESHSNISILKYYIGRVSLPVFPDYLDLRKDPSTQELIKSTQKFHIVPKFDGSLFVLSLVKSNTPQYELIKKILPKIDSQAWYENYYGIWCFGSKSCMFAKNQYGFTGVLTRILNSINASYQSVDNFINKVTMEIESNGYGLLYESLSLIFEAIDEIPTQELTVDYKKAFCPFLCWVGWDGKSKKVLLPNNIIYLNPYAQVTTVNSWDEVLEFKSNAYLRLLNGSEFDEPEGYVVWLDDTNIGVKLKHTFYYVAHKPYSIKNNEMAKRIEFDDEYSKLRQRLVKFKPKPSVISLIKNNLDLISNIFLDNYTFLNTKKNWAIQWKNNTNICEINKILELVELDIVQYYPQFANCLKNKGFNIAMDYFDKRDEWQEYLISKYLKI